MNRNTKNTNINIKEYLLNSTNDPKVDNIDIIYYLPLKIFNLKIQVVQIQQLL